MLIKKLLVCSLYTLILVTDVYSDTYYDTSYGKVTDIRIWNSAVNVFLTADSVCADGLKERYKLDKSKNQMYSAVLAAMMAGKYVSFNYWCDASGVANIFGVRLQEY